MKSQTIGKIHQMLKEKVQNTQHTYITTKHQLEEKYGEEWLDNVATQKEKKQLEEESSAYYEALALLEDFENHQF